VARSSRKTEKRPSRLRIRIERIVLGAVMSIAVFVVERRLRKALGLGRTPEGAEEDVFSKTVGFS
jgi:hypothetical protein